MSQSHTPIAGGVYRADADGSIAQELDHHHQPVEKNEAPPKHSAKATPKGSKHSHE